VKIEYMPLSELKKFPGNAKAHDLASIKKSIVRFGFTSPVMLDEKTGRIIAGHGRSEALGELQREGASVPDRIKAKGNEWLVPVLRGLEFANEQEAEAYLLADNKLTENGGWLEKELLEALERVENLDGIGFDDDEIKELRARVDAMESEEGQTDQDAVPEVSETPISETGKIYKLGRHRLACGDGSDADLVDRLFDGATATLVFTDPPYGVAIGTKNKLLNKFQGVGINIEEIKSDDVSPEELAQILSAIFLNIKRVLSDDCSVFVCSPSGGDVMMMMMMMKNCGLPVRHVLNWIKNQPTFSLGRLDYDYQHEPILFTWTKRHKKIMGGMFKTSLWAVDKPRRCDVHPTMKPVELPKNAILNHSENGDIVFDPFLGSGTTLIAAEKTGRTCYGVEISPKYCDQIRKRWAEFVHGEGCEWETLTND